MLVVAYHGCQKAVSIQLNHIQPPVKQSDQESHNGKLIYISRVLQ